MNVTLHIERLVVDAGASFEPEALRAALEAELSRLMTAMPPQAIGAALESVRVAEVLPAATSAAQWGQGIARAVHGIVGGRGEARTKPSPSIEGSKPSPSRGGHGRGWVSASALPAFALTSKAKSMRDVQSSPKPIPTHTLPLKGRVSGRGRS